MSKIDIDYINKNLLMHNENTFKLEEVSYPPIRYKDNCLVDDNGCSIGTKGDYYTKRIIEEILSDGTFDNNPRPKYESDGRPAYTISLNNRVFFQYDISRGESPLITLRPIAVKKSIGEVLWIYKDASSNLDILKDKYGITWWDEWEVKDKNNNPTRSIGSVYGNTVRDYDQMKRLLHDLKTNPDSRRHIIDLWQLEEFKRPHGLRPCAYQSVWNVRHGKDGVDYLDMKLIQRSSDFLVAGCINQVQYMTLLMMVAQSVGLRSGVFTWDVENIQIYDRHIKSAIELLRRNPIKCSPYIELNKEVRDFYKFNIDDIKISDYPRELIKRKNPQIRFDKGV